MSCGKYIFSSIVKSHPYRAAMRPSSDSSWRSDLAAFGDMQTIIYELKFPAIVRLRVSILKMKNSARPMKFG